MIMLASILQLLALFLALGAGASHPALPEAAELHAALQQADKAFVRDLLVEGLIEVPEMKNEPGRILSFSYAHDERRAMVAERVEAVTALPAQPRVRNGKLFYATLEFTAFREIHNDLVGWLQREHTGGFFTTDVSELYAQPYTMGLMVESHQSHRMDRPFVKYLWCMGRGFSDRLTTITELRWGETGLLHIVAEGWGVSPEPAGTWRIVVDPEKNWLVREARFQRATTPDIYEFVITTIGETGSPAFPAAESATCIIRVEGPKTQTVTLSNVQHKGATEMLDERRSAVFGPYEEPTSLLDMRAAPLHVGGFFPGEAFPVDAMAHKETHP